MLNYIVKKFALYNSYVIKDIGRKLKCLHFYHSCNFSNWYLVDEDGHCFNVDSHGLTTA